MGATDFLTALLGAAVDDPSRNSPSAGDGGYCAELAIRQKKAAESQKTPQPLSSYDLVKQQAIGLVTLARVASAYFNPSPIKPVEITTPGGQKIFLNRDFAACYTDEIPEDEDDAKEYTLMTGLLLPDKATGKNPVINGVELKSREKVEIYTSYGLKSAMLATDFPLTMKNGQTVWLAQDNPIEFYNNEEMGKPASIKKAVLAKDTLINDRWYLAGHKIGFYDDGTFKRGTLRDPADFPKEKIYCDAGTTVYYHQKDGSFMATILQDNKTVPTDYGDITLANDEYYEVHPDGRFADGTLADIGKPIQLKLTENDGDKKIALCQPESEIQFFPSGKLQQMTLAEELSFDGVLYAKGSKITFYESGRVQKGRLGEPTAYTNLNPPITFAAGTEIELYESGMPENGEQDPQYKISIDDILKDDNGKSIELLQGRNVGYNESGWIRSVRIKNDTLINGFWYKGGEKIHFYDEGEFKKGILAKNGAAYPELYRDKFIFAEGTECGVKHNGKGEPELYGMLAFPVTFTVTVAGKPIKLSINQGSKIKFKSDHSIKGGVLGKKTEIFDGVWLKEDGWFEFGEDDGDQYVGGDLDHDTPVSGYDLKEGQGIDLFLDGALKSFDAVEDEEGNPIPESWSDIYPELQFTSVGLYNINTLVDDGDITQEYADSLGRSPMANGRLFEDVPLELPGFDNVILQNNCWVEFYPTGSIKGGRLVEAATYDHPLYGKITLEEGTWVELNEDGTLRGGVPVDSLSIPTAYTEETGENLELKPNLWVEFYDGLDGETIKSGTLLNDYLIINSRIGSFEIAKDFEAIMYPHQELQTGSLTEDTAFYVVPPTFLDTEAVEGKYFWFRGGCPAENEETTDDKQPKGPASDCELDFDEDEHLLGGFMAEEYFINGQSYRFGDWFETSDMQQ